MDEFIPLDQSPTSTGYLYFVDIMIKIVVLMMLAVAVIGPYDTQGQTTHRQLGNATAPISGANFSFIKVFDPVTFTDIYRLQLQLGSDPWHQGKIKVPKATSTVTIRWHLDRYGFTFEYTDAVDFLEGVPFYAPVRPIG